MGTPLGPKIGHFNLVTEMKLQEAVAQWLNWDKNEETNQQIRTLWESRDVDARTPILTDLLLSRLEFGTAGLRGRMEAGYSRMNDLVVIQTTQGLAAYLESTEGIRAKTRGIVIGYDVRRNSERFAGLAAVTLILRGFVTHLFSGVVPTPFVPFCVKEKNCIAGIMITASHNPKDDNGYKLYWHNGAQIVPPHDRNIQRCILSNLKPHLKAFDMAVLDCGVPLKTDPMEETLRNYFAGIKDSLFDPTMNEAFKNTITYSAMHGVGYPFMDQAFKEAKFKNLIPVMAQRDPDPEFPTVVFPNPEEGESALNLSIETADNAKSNLILANDPDADRLAVAEKNPSGKWVIFTGNELGALLGWWMYYSYTKRNPEVQTSDIYMLGSTVSTKFLQSMAVAEGFNYVETLTGFKWMGNKACELLTQGKKVLFAFEEAIGFMCGTAVLDKDGISAGVHVAELAAYLNTLGLSLYEKLQQLYSRYGVHISKNSYFLCQKPRVTKAIFETLRNHKGESRTYPEGLCGGKYVVKDVRDLTTGFDTSQPKKRAILPVSATSQMITFKFKNGLVATLRASGTEPKIKYYTELCATPDQGDIGDLQTTLDEMVEALIGEWIQPQLHGLQSPPPHK